MSRIGVLGAGIAGHTAAAFLRKWLRTNDEVALVSSQPDYNWIASDVWVGVGFLRNDQTTVAVAPICQDHNIEFKQAQAVALFPGGNEKDQSPRWRLSGLATEPAGNGNGMTS